MSLKTAWLYDRSNKPIVALGIIQSISETVNSSNLTKPIITYSAENTFTMDMSTVQSFSMKFARANDSNDGNVVEDPSSPTGERPMNNKEWISKVRSLINQWQAEHDGYILKYNADGKFKNHRPIDQVVYIKSFSHTFSCGVPEYITGDIVFQPGSMKPKSSSVTLDQTDALTNNDELPNAEDTTFYSDLKVPLSDVEITMTNSTQTIPYKLFSSEDMATMNAENKRDQGCISSYSMTYGPTDPFPYITMRIVKKRLAVKAPDLVDDIIAGKNRIYVKACGMGQFIVTKCKTTEQTYNITAYAIEEVYKGLMAGISYDAGFTGPLEIIKNILSRKISVGGLVLNYLDDKIVCPHSNDFINERNRWVDKGGNNEVMFSPNDTCWHIMSVCANYMGMTMWFGEGKVYLVAQNMIVDHKAESQYIPKTFYLNIVDDNEKITPPEDRIFSTRVLDKPEIGDEGIDTLINKYGVSYSLGVDSSSLHTLYSYDFSDPNIFASQKTYGIRTSNSFSIPEFKRYYYARDFANRMVLLYTDTQQSISFTVSELKKNDEGKDIWQSIFPMVCTTDGFIDYNTNTHLSIMSSYSVDDHGHKVKLPQKTSLSSITRNFPEFTSTYTFGRIANADLSQTTSNILQAIGNK